MSSRPTSPLSLALAGMVGMAVVMGIGRFVYTPILPGMMHGLGLSASDAGLIASANYIGYLVGAILGGGNWATGRERAIMRIGLLASALLAALMGLTDSVAAFAIIRFLAGVTSALVMIFLTSIVFSRTAAAGRADLQAWHFGGVGLGIAISAVMIGALDFLGAAWPAGWLWAGVLSLVGAAIVWLVVDRGPRADATAQAEPPLPKNPAFIRIVVAYGMFGFGYIVTATFLIAIVRQGDAGRFFESAVWLAAGVAGFPSVWLWSRVARRISLSAAFAVSCTVEALGVLASVSLGGFIGPMLGGILLGGTFIAITAFGLQTGRLLAVDAPRRALAIMSVAFGTGQILGPIVAGYMADFTGDFTIPSVAAALALFAAAGISVSARRRAL